MQCEKMPRAFEFQDSPKFLLRMLEYTAIGDDDYSGPQIVAFEPHDLEPTPPPIVPLGATTRRPAREFIGDLYLVIVSSPQLRGDAVGPFLHQYCKSLPQSQCLADFNKGSTSPAGTRRSLIERHNGLCSDRYASVMVSANTGISKVIVQGCLSLSTINLMTVNYRIQFLTTKSQTSVISLFTTFPKNPSHFQPRRRLPHSFIPPNSPYTHPRRNFSNITLR